MHVINHFIVNYLIFFFILVLFLRSLATNEIWLSSNAIREKSLNKKLLNKDQDIVLVNNIFSRDTQTIPERCREHATVWAVQQPQRTWAQLQVWVTGL